MKARLMSDERLKRYLLGKLSPAEQTRCEKRYFADQETFQQLLSLETELIDAYVGGELSRWDRRQFEKRFLSSPERRERVALARALRRRLSEAPAADVRAGAESEPASGWPAFLAHWRGQTAGWRLSLAAAPVVVVVFGSWLLVQHFELRSELARTRAQLVERERKLVEQTAEQRAQIEELTNQLERQPGERTGRTETQPRTVSLLLSAGLLRGGSEPARLVIPPGATRARLQLSAESDEFPTYEALLQTASGNEVWRQGSLKASLRGSGRVVVVTVPAGRFLAGDYVLILEGITPEGGREAVGEYTFRVVRK